nr:hypothetical protein CFP56_72401 [Quercus suber]
MPAVYQSWTLEEPLNGLVCSKQLHTAQAIASVAPGPRQKAICELGIRIYVAGPMSVMSCSNNAGYDLRSSCGRLRHDQARSVRDAIYDHPAVALDTTKLGRCGMRSTIILRPLRHDQARSTPARFVHLLQVMSLANIPTLSATKARIGNMKDEDEHTSARPPRDCGASSSLLVIRLMLASTRTARGRDNSTEYIIFATGILGAPGTLQVS